MNPAVTQPFAEGWERLDKAARNRDTAAKLLLDKEKTLRDLGVTAGLDELRRQCANKTAEAEQHEKTAAERGRADLPTLQKRLAEAEKKVRADEQLVASVRGQQSTLRGQLSPNWNSQFDDLDATAVDALDAERQQLMAAGVVELCRQLAEDAIRRVEWLKQLAETTAEIDGKIPEGSRVAVAVAEQVQLARQAVDDAEDAERR